jgi:hypothetical protein
VGRSDGELLGYTLGAKLGVLLGGLVKQIHVGELDGIKLGE